MGAPALPLCAERPWLATIARRCAIDVYRRSARGSHGPLDEGDPALVELPPSVGPRLRHLGSEIVPWSQLPPQEAELVRLQHLEGLTQHKSHSAWGSPSVQ